MNAGNENDIDAAFATLAERRIGALLVTSIPIFTRRRDYLVALAARHAMPAIYGQREFVADGGLMSISSTFHNGASVHERCHQRYCLATAGGLRYPNPPYR